MYGIRLSEEKGMNYQLHFLRFFAACAVILSHSFVLCQGDFKNEWLYKLTKGQMTMGSFSVCIFFFFAGYLITNSAKKAKSAKRYFVARSMRIFPALIVVVLGCMFVLGPLVSTYNAKEYFTNPLFFKYFLNIFLIPQHDLPGVFQNNVYLPTVNGSLWTLPVEFLCYVLCFIAYKMGLLKKKKSIYMSIVVTIGSVGVLVLAHITQSAILVSVLLPCLLFYMGMLFQIYSENIIINIKVAIICLVLWVVFICLGAMLLGMVLFFPYILIYLVFGIKMNMQTIGAIGEYSYGIYLLGFPIQQLFVFLGDSYRSVYVNAGVSVVIAFVISIFVLHKIERPILNMAKNRKWM